MKLLLDIGNTRLKWGLASDAGIESTGAIAAAQLDGSALRKCFLPLFGDSDNAVEIEALWVSNVGPDAQLQTLQDWFEKQSQMHAHIIDVATPVPGFHNRYKAISNLGVDRWVAAIGARHIVQTGDIIIIDAGTAVTIDWLSADNCFEGGVIMPGVALMHQALVGGTSGIKSEVSKVRQIIGKTTSECVNSGIGFGMGGAVERIVEEMKETIKSPVSLVLTGGGAEHIAQISNINAISEPDLMLHGLQQLSLLTSPTIPAER